ncbi:hypothetical protein [Rhodococcus jostii]|uniref:hypothetical protein n=1 Tax=Rhodococcus jostii TaxID=132919 RepID=UPI00362E3EC0
MELNADLSWAEPAGVVIVRELIDVFELAVDNGEREKAVPVRAQTSLTGIALACGGKCG